MSLALGTRLGPSEIQSAIGAGGMGEVCRARDLQLNRDVALKVLPESFAAEPDRLAHGPIALDEVLPIARQIAEALEAAPAHGIIDHPSSRVGLWR